MNNKPNLCRKLQKYSVCMALLVGLFSIPLNGVAGDRYLLCGPDEDGCFEETYPYCGCIPYNELHGNQPYCLDFDELRCTPLSETPNCKSQFIYQNQGECVATIFQSEPIPPCRMVTHEFCLKNHLAFCAPDGHVDSCHYN